MFVREFWIRASERALKTSAQFALVAWGGNTVSVWDVSVQAVVGMAISGAVVSLLTSIASTAVGDGRDPSLVDPHPSVF